MKSIWLGTLLIIFPLDSAFAWGEDGQLARFLNEAYAPGSCKP